MNRVRTYAVLGVAALAGVGTAAITGLASAKSKPKPTLQVAHNVKVGSKTESVVVNLHGITLYTLSDETTKPHHVKLTCTQASGCFSFWFPLTVRSGSKITAASGIKGKLGTLHRNGFIQVTLGGKPLYTFKGDEDSHGKPVKGMTTGEGIPTFGGVWRVIVVKSSSTHTTTSTTTTTASSPMPTTTSTNPYPTLPGY